MGGLSLDDDEAPLAFDFESYSPPACPLARHAIPPRDGGSAAAAAGGRGGGMAGGQASKDGVGVGVGMGVGMGGAALHQRSLASSSVSQGPALGSARDALRLSLDHELAAHVVLLVSQHRAGLSLPAAGLAVLRLVVSPLVSGCVLVTTCAGGQWGALSFLLLLPSSSSLPPSPSSAPLTQTLSAPP